MVAKDRKAEEKRESRSKATNRQFERCFKTCCVEAVISNTVLMYGKDVLKVGLVSSSLTHTRRKLTMEGGRYVYLILVVISFCMYKDHCVS